MTNTNKTSIVLAAAFFGFMAGSTLTAVPAFAGQVMVDCRNVTVTACEAIKAALRRAPYIGPIRQAKEPMACARVVGYGPSPVVWIEGTSRNYVNAPVIAKTGVVYTEPFSLNPAWTVTESCIPRRLLNGVDDLTICTGLQDGYHWSLTSAELRAMKKDGHFTSYAPFLTVRDRDSLSVAAVTRAYKTRYFARRTN